MATHQELSMHLLIILTILLTGSTYAFNDTKEYVTFLKDEVAINFKYSKLECEKMGYNYFSCELVRTGGSRDDYGHEYVYMVKELKFRESGLKLKGVNTPAVTMRGY